MLRKKVSATGGCYEQGQREGFTSDRGPQVGIVDGEEAPSRRTHDYDRNRDVRDETQDGLYASQDHAIRAPGIGYTP